METRGFTVIEVLIAIAVLAVGVLACVQLAAIAIAATASASVQNIAVIAASERLEELRGLAYEYDESGGPVTDLSTDLSTPGRGSGGRGLTPGGALDSDVAGYCDHLDRTGRWLGNGPIPADAAFTRRWSIAHASVGSDLLVVQVAVVPASARGGGAADGVSGAARLLTLRTRMAR